MSKPQATPKRTPSNNFGQELSGQLASGWRPAPSGSRPSLPRRAARHEQRRNVAASDQQRRSPRPQQHQQRGRISLHQQPAASAPPSRPLAPSPGSSPRGLADRYSTQASACLDRVTPRFETPDPRRSRGRCGRACRSSPRSHGTKRSEARGKEEVWSEHADDSIGGHPTAFCCRSRSAFSSQPAPTDRAWMITMLWRPPPPSGVEKAALCELRAE